MTYTSWVFFLTRCYIKLFLKTFSSISTHTLERMPLSALQWHSVSLMDEVGHGGKSRKRSFGGPSLSLVSTDSSISLFFLLWFHCHVLKEPRSLPASAFEAVPHQGCHLHPPHFKPLFCNWYWELRVSEMLSQCSCLVPNF